MVLLNNIILYILYNIIIYNILNDVTVSECLDFLFLTETWQREIQPLI